MGLGESILKEATADYQNASLDSLAKKSKANSIFARFWMTEDPTERRRLIQECVTLSTQAAQSFENANDTRNLALTHRDLMAYLREAIYYAQDSSTLRRTFDTGLSVCKKAAVEFDVLDSAEGLLEALLFNAWLITDAGDKVLEPRAFRQHEREIEKLVKRCIELSEKAGTPYANFLAKNAAAYKASLLDGDNAKALGLFKEAVSSAIETGDSCLIGDASARTTYASFWAALTVEDLDLRRELLNTGVEAGIKALRELEIPLNGTMMLYAHAFAAETFGSLALYVETNPDTKRENLRRAIEMAAEGLLYEGHGWASIQLKISLMKQTYLLATQYNDGERLQLLNRALPLGEEVVRNLRSLAPLSWDLGVSLNYLARVKAELSDVENDPRRRIEVLESAALNMEGCLSICASWADYDPGLMRSLAQYAEGHGDALLKLYMLDSKQETALRALKAFEDSKNWLGKANLVAPVPLLSWKSAKVYDLLGKYHDASSLFRSAAEDFRKATKKIPSLSSFFGDLAFYMDAWAGIENARRHHEQRQYSDAVKDYEMTSSILGATKTWNHLSKHYAACASLENGESYSWREKPEAAFKALNKAAETFKEATTTIDLRLRACSEPGEKDELSEWLIIAKIREKYCEAKAHLEEARLLDRIGEDEASLEKYLAASDAFKVLQEREAPQGLDDLKTITLFCKAWANMKQAEVRGTPELYNSAAKIFLKAEGSAPDEGYRRLALANASICRALASSSSFRRTRETRLYSAIKNQLEIAADNYELAGFERAGSWTRATEKFIDALAYLADAERKRDAGKKSELFGLAEKHLDLASRLYSKAGFRAKETEAKKLLRHAREGKELLRPAEVLAGNPVKHQGSMPASLLKDRPLGLERFESANIVGRISVSEKVLGLGSTTAVEMEMINLGNKPATLIRVEGLSQDGLEIERERLSYPVRDNCLDLKGKRLQHLQTHSVRVCLRSGRKGAFELRPRIVLVGDDGSERSCEFEPVALMVRESSLPESFRSTISEFESRISAAPNSWFETSRGRRVFEHLVKVFLRDYMSKGLYSERAGWRSLMDIVREVKIPKSAFYRKGGGDGAVLVELERRGLMERRIFPEERGRGGAITRIRLAYENPEVRKFVKQAVFENF